MSRRNQKQHGPPGRQARKGWGYVALAALSLLALGVLGCKRADAPQMVAPAGAPLTAPVTVDALAAWQPVTALGQGQARRVVFDPTGNWLAVHTTAGVSLYDARTWQPLDFGGSSVPVRELAFGPNGRYLALAPAYVPEVQIWRLPEGDLLHTLPRDGLTLHNLVFLPRGAALAVSTFSSITLWQTADGALLRTLSPPEPYRLMPAAVAADGARLVAPLNRESVDALMAWPLDGEAPPERFVGEAGAWFIGGQFAPQGGRYAAIYGRAAWGDSARLLVWEPGTGRAPLALDGPAHLAGEAWRFLPDGRQIAAGYLNGAVVVWDAATGQSQMALTPPGSAAVQALEITADGRRLVVVYADGRTALWRLPAGELERLWPVPVDGAPDQVALHPDGRYLALVMANGRVRLWELARGEESAVLEQHMTGAVRDLAFAPDGALLAVGAANGQVQVWDTAVGALMRRLPDHGGRVDTVAFSADGALLATGVGQRVGVHAFDDTIRIWETATATLRWEFAGSGEAVEGCAIFRNRAAFTPDNALLAATSHDFSVQVWEVASGAPRWTLVGHTQPVLDLAIAPDGALLASAAEDGAIHLWRLADGVHLRSLSSPTMGFVAVAFAPDGRLVAGGTANGDVFLWEAESGRLVRQLAGGMFKQTTIAFSPDGALIAAGHGPALRLWSVATGAIVGELPSLGGDVVSIAFARVGGLLAFGTESGVVHLWRQPSP
jgi:WD40 repeat protein